MTISMYSASVPVFNQMLNSLSSLLKKGEQHAADKAVDPATLLDAQLIDDMFPLIRQVQIACDFAKGVSARLAGAEMPAFDDSEKSFADLQARIEKTLSFINGLTADAFEGSEEKPIVLRPGTPKERTLEGHSYLLHYGLPQFFFHVTTAYALLRHKGVSVGKGDFMGSF